MRLLNSLLELPFHFGKTEERTVAFQKEEWRRGEIALADLSIGQEDVIAILSIRPNLKQHIKHLTMYLICHHSRLRISDIITDLLLIPITPVCPNRRE